VPEASLDPGVLERPEVTPDLGLNLQLLQELPPQRRGKALAWFGVAARKKGVVGAVKVGQQEVTSFDDDVTRTRPPRPASRGRSASGSDSRSAFPEAATTSCPKRRRGAASAGGTSASRRIRAGT